MSRKHFNNLDAPHCERMPNTWDDIEMKMKIIVTLLGMTAIPFAAILIAPLFK